MINMGDWTFEDCDERQKKDIVLIEGYSQELKKTIGCTCKSDSLNYHTKAIDALNYNIRINFTCKDCSKTGSINYPFKENY